jgi:Tfp pilus tip-associated adhesin PilY1
MRRGGRMLYGINVTDPNNPVFKWRAGCPNLGNQTGCTEGMEDIGQTWSTPSVAFIRGFSSTTPVLVVGGGYAGCEDANGVKPSCDDAKGGYIYLQNADTGALLRKFRTERPVPSDIAMVDINNDAAPDYAYAADTGGNVYRISFIDGPTTKIPLSETQWTSSKVATTDQQSGRKFLHAPALLYSDNKVYVALGSGDREHPMLGDYPYTSNVVNRFYVYLDNLEAAVGAATVNLDGMANYTLSDSCTSPAVLPDAGLAGWFMDMTQNGRGEQVVTSALIAGGMVTFSTNRPIPAPAASCATTLGEARGYWVNLLNGAGAIGVPGACGGRRSSVFVGGGLPPSPVFANSVGIGSGASSETVSVVLGAVQKNGAGISATISPVEMRPAISLKRKRAYTYTKGD